MHEPVLVGEVVPLLQPRPDGVYVDCTLGYGGHTEALLSAGGGRVIGIDRDEMALEEAAVRLGRDARLELVHDDYRRLGAILQARGVPAVDGIVADLGVSSMQLDRADRGFSFRQAGPLDMRMDRTRGATLAERLAGVDDVTLADVIWRFGEERLSRRIARSILRARDHGELTDTAALASAVRRGVGGRTGRIDPATRTFQALRIWVNDELDGLDRFIDTAASLLVQGGRLAIIAFHSLEDRVVKHTMRNLAASTGTLRLVTRRAIVASEAECAANPRSRSARLRVVEKIA